jgi:uncharacterized protein (DUF1697 family)
MSRYTAFLRGMNVGNRRLTNEELCAVFAQLGFRDIASFRASGNVVFAAGRSEIGQRPAAEVTKRIEKGLAEALGYAVPTYVRTAQEVQKIAASRPFAAELVEASVGKLHVGLLSRAPSASTQADVLSLGSDQDRLAFGKRELYWLASGRMIESGLDLKAVESELGAMTLRTKSTIELIAGKYFLQ